MPFSNSSKDLVIALTCSLVTLALAAYFDLNESFIEWAEDYEDYELDELPVAAAAFAISFGWFAWRRWNELQSIQSVLQQRLKDIQQLQIAEQLGKQFAVEKSHQLALVGEMTEALLISDSEEEALRIFRSYADSFITSETGAVIVKSATDSSLIISQWNGCKDRYQALDFNRCWSHRANKAYDTDMGFCERSCGASECRQVCIPVSNAGNCHGVITVDLADSENRAVADLTDTVMPAASVLAITLSNLGLRNDLFEQSIIDPLTGLFNRRGWQEKVQSVLDELPADTVFSIINIDVDNFKLINDKLGHEAGDRTLTLLAGVIRSCTRAQDLVCRVGGDEILILLPEMGNQEAAEKGLFIAQRYSEGGGRQFPEYQQGFSLSIGVATYPDDGVGIRELVARSDSLLYKAKNQGKGRVASDSGVAVSGNLAELS